MNSTGRHIELASPDQFLPSPPDNEWRRLSRLRGLGVTFPESVPLPKAPELALYTALGEECDDPYFRYNALRRELDSFVAALESRRPPRS